MTDTFISYSRYDAAMAKVVLEYLSSNDLEAWIDIDDRIPAGEQWSHVVERAIEEAGSLIVVVTHHALASHEVAREVEHARHHGKPVIPLIMSLPDDGTDEDVASSPAPIDFSRLPIWLMEHQVIDARSTPQTHALDQLVSSVRRDYDWRRFHGALITRARRWEEGNGSLLVDQDLSEAISWLKTVPSESAKPTDLQRSYIRISAAAQDRRRVEKADRLAELVLTGFYDPDLAIPLAAENIVHNAASDRAVLALDYALRQSRSLGTIGPSGDIEIVRFLDKGKQLFIVNRDDRK